MADRGRRALDRRTFLKGAGAALGGAALAGCSSPAARPAGGEGRRRRPNIVYILADDLGYHELGCYGQEKIRTPNIDRLRARGMKFTDHYAGSPVCAPSRCTLLTGKHTGHAWIRNNGLVRKEGQAPIPSREPTVAEVLKEAGYATACIGKWGLGYPGSEGDPLNQGFDRFFGFNCQTLAHNHYPRFLRRNREKVFLEGNDGGPSGKQYAPDLFRDEALEFIRENKDRPFFLYYATTLPHLALQVPEDSLKEYLGKWPDPPYEGGRGYFPCKHPRATYAAMVTRMDSHVGEITALLERLGLAGDTVIFFASDNGATFGRVGGSDSFFFESNAPLRGFKASVYEGGIRVPMIAVWPGKIRPGTVTHLPSAFWDVMPTLAEIAGVDAPGGIDGISFLPTLLGRPAAQERHEYLLWDYPGRGGQVAVRMGRWKGVKRGLKKNPGAPLELYDLEVDVGEARDVAASHPEIARKIGKIMVQGRTRAPLKRSRFWKYGGG